MNKWAIVAIVFIPLMLSFLGFCYPVPKAEAGRQDNYRGEMGRYSLEMREFNGCEYVVVSCLYGIGIEHHGKCKNH
tara:strand:- start:1245 stop:1472 length:228 start_codon:yes stop_codon:yes gene_type:complete